MNPPRLIRLDSLRGLAACGVAFGYHGANHLAPGGLPGDSWLAPLAWLRTWGWSLVDLFFVLSGFVFAHVYLPGDALRRPGGQADFAVARIARLWPLHVLVLVAVAAAGIGGAANTPGAFAAHLFLLQAWVPPFSAAFNEPAWSISVELFCYAVFARAAAMGPGALRLAGALAIGWSLLFLARNGQPGGPWSGDDFARGLLGFFAGVALWHARGRLDALPWPVLTAGLAAGLMIPTGAWSSVPPLALLAWPAALLLALRSPLLDHPVLHWLGDRSYAIYLIHLPVVLTLARLDAHGAGALAAAVAVTLVLADLSFRWLEQPARAAIRARWRAHRGRGAHAQPA